MTNQEIINAAKSCGKTQMEIAKLVGLTQAQVSRILSGKSKLSAANAYYWQVKLNLLPN